MYTQYKFAITLLMLLACILSACGSRTKFVAPEIDPPADLIPGYVPEGFELVSGFQLTGEVTLPEFSNGDEDGFFGHLLEDDPFFDVKSPNGNDIQGVYYQGKDHLILISKSFFPEGTLDLWRTAYEESWPKPCECAGFPRLDPEAFPVRFYNDLQEERTIGKTSVAILKGPLGWITVFIRGDHLLTVESGISLEENLKIVASLLDN
jgi:hypothetical protein